jgi:hypothetical protein
MIPTCNICGHPSGRVFEAEVLHKYQVAYFRCSHCGFVQTETPYWLEEAYSNPINLSDTGIVRRNIMACRSLSAVLYFLFDRQGTFLDYAGGYGLLTRMMRDIGFDFYTWDPHTPNLMARGFEYNPSSPIELLSCFECFEHLSDPMSEIQKMLGISRNFFFSTQLLPQPVPLPSDWWYYNPSHGQHISLYAPQTLDYIARKFNLQVYSMKGYHLFTDKKLPPFSFQLLTGAGRFGLGGLVSVFRKSKVWEDYHALLR